jgi:hypothetical protein
VKGIRKCCIYNVMGGYKNEEEEIWNVALKTPKMRPTVGMVNKVRWVKLNKG